MTLFQFSYPVNCRPLRIFSSVCWSDSLKRASKKPTYDTLLLFVMKFSRKRGLLLFKTGNMIAVSTSHKHVHMILLVMNFNQQYNTLLSKHALIHETTIICNELQQNESHLFKTQIRLATLYSNIKMNVHGGEI